MFNNETFGFLGPSWRISCI